MKINVQDPGLGSTYCHGITAVFAVIFFQVKGSASLCLILVLHFELDINQTNLETMDYVHLVNSP